jgi:hypothetical protein
VEKKDIEERQREKIEEEKQRREIKERHWEI